MSSPAAPTARRAVRAPRASLSATVLRLATVALVAAVLVWSVLFVDLLRKRADTSTALAQPSSQPTNPDAGQPAQAPAPVTTRTS
jgi:hypothetical protein